MYTSPIISVDGLEYLDYFFDIASKLMCPPLKLFKLRFQKGIMLLFLNQLYLKLEEACVQKAYHFNLNAILCNKLL